MKKTYQCAMHGFEKCICCKGDIEARPELVNPVLSGSYFRQLRGASTDYWGHRPLVC